MSKVPAANLFLAALLSEFVFFFALALHLLSFLVNKMSHLVWIHVEKWDRHMWAIFFQHLLFSRTNSGVANMRPTFWSLCEREPDWP